ncbi:gamma-interferon-responsive lysosomal thiol protein-like [Aristolochia californica]|uniref:gamma-interferon-responsive lysosomal thiol protein-like n=1 Tax=Aristolochia californica TaxID=171875 RepID=UPI0035E0358E
MAFELRFFLASLLLSPFSFSFPAAADKVPLALYYETLCPYCSNFIVNHLSKIFSNGLLDVIDLKLVPYGNARLGSNNSISCQHGPYECLLNTVEACAINIWPDVHKHFSLINCIESLVVERKYTDWESCFQRTGSDSHPVADCYSRGDGQKLELLYAAETSALEPPHTYVPWVVVDGRPLYEDYENFETYICKAYKGPLPEACKALPILTTAQKKPHRLAHVCYAKKISSPISVRRQMMEKIM